MLEEDIIDRAKFLEIQEPHHNIELGVKQAIREMADNKTFSYAASIFDIDINEYERSLIDSAKK